MTRVEHLHLQPFQARLPSRVHADNCKENEPFATDLKAERCVFNGTQGLENSTSPNPYTTEFDSAKDVPNTTHPAEKWKQHCSGRATLQNSNLGQDLPNALDMGNHVGSLQQKKKPISRRYYLSTRNSSSRVH